MLQRMNLRKDIDLNIILDTARAAAEVLHKDLPGMVYKTGSIEQQVHA